MWRWWGSALAALALLAGWAIWLQPGRPLASGSAQRNVAAAFPVMPQAGPAGAAAAALEAGAPEAASWSGTVTDGAIHLDEHGQVLPDRALRHLFDYLLTAQGELGLDEIRQRLAASGRQQALSPGQQSQLLALFEQYWAYLQALPGVTLRGTDAESLRHTADARKALRRSLLGVAMSEGFFAEDEARERYEIELVAIRQNPALTPQARAAALQLLRQQAPVAVQQLDQRSAQIANLSAATDELRNAGAGAAAVQALREREVGPAAAARLAALDAERAAWQQRVTAFRSAREQLLADPAFAPEDRQRQIEALIAQGFSAPEAVRLRAQLGF